MRGAREEATLRGESSKREGGGINSSIGIRSRNTTIQNGRGGWRSGAKDVKVAIKPVHISSHGDDRP